MYECSRVALIAQLGEHCTGIAEVVGLNPAQSLKIFSGLCSSSVTAALVFTSLIRICSLNLKPRHFVTLATPKAVYMKKNCPACQGYPTCRGETTRPPELSRPPRRVRVPNVNGWLKFGKKQAKRYLG